MTILNNHLKEELKDEYPKLYEFYQNSWQGDFEYRIYLTPNDKVLNEEFYQSFMSDLSVSSSEKEKVKNIRNKTFTNDFGIMTKISELVNYYLKNKKLPKILVICNETDYGMEYAKFFYELEELILAEWKNNNNGVLTDDDYYCIHFAILKSLNVRIYKKYRLNFMPADFFLFDNTLQSSIKCVCDSTRSRQFVNKTHVGISENKAKKNHNFFPTFVIPLNDFRVLRNDLENNTAWQEKTWRYNSRLYRMIISSNNSDSLLEILSCTIDKNNNCSYIVPNIFTGGLTSNLRMDLIDALSTFFSKNNLTQFNKIIDYNNSATIQNFYLSDSVKFELIYSLMSISTFIRYLKTNNLISDTEIENIIKYNKASIEMICQNFGTIADVFDDYNEFMNLLLNNSNTLDEFNSIIFAYFGKKACSLDSKNKKTEDVYTHDTCIYEASDYFIDLVHKSEDIYKRMIENNFRFANKYSKYYCGSDLENYLSRLSDKFSVENKICALLCLIDQGYIEQSMAVSDNNLTYYSILPNTYLLEFKKLERFMPALICLNKNCFLNGLIFEVWALRFANFIIENLPEYANDDLLNSFYRFSHYVDFTYDNTDGWYYRPYNVFKPELNISAPYRTIKEWSGNPWSEKEIKEIENISAEEYINREFQIRNKLFQFLLDNFQELSKYNSSVDEKILSKKLIKTT